MNHENHQNQEHIYTQLRILGYLFLGALLITFILQVFELKNAMP